MAKSPDDAMATMIANLKEKTGRTLPEWVKLVAKSGLDKHGLIVAMLKADHGVSHGYANLIAATALQGDGPAPGGDDLVAAMFAGEKQALLPVWTAIEKAVRAFGGDVDVSPKKTKEKAADKVLTTGAPLQVITESEFLKMIAP